MTMKTLDEAIRQMMRDWPSLWHNRALCLDRIFIEGRDHWTNELGEPTPLHLARGHALEHAREMFIESQAEKRKSFAERPEAYPGMMERSLQDGKEFFESKIARIEKVFVDFDATVAGAGSLVTAHFSPMTPNCRWRGTLQRMMDSDDAPADWVAGARETCALILACPFEETENKNLARNKRIARKVLKALDKTYGKGETPDISYVTWNEAHPFSETVALRAKMKTYFGDKKAKRKKAKQSA
jgi:hypothetical protein